MNLLIDEASRLVVFYVVLKGVSEGADGVQSEPAGEKSGPYLLGLKMESVKNMGRLLFCQLKNIKNTRWKYTKISEWL